MNATARKVLDRITQFQNDPKERKLLVAVVKPYFETADGRAKLAHSVWNPLRIRLDRHIASFKIRTVFRCETMSDEPMVSKDYTAMLVNVDDMIAQGNDFYALAFTKNEEADIDFRKLKSLIDEMSRFRSEVAFRANPPG